MAITPGTVSEYERFGTQIVDMVRKARQANKPIAQETFDDLLSIIENLYTALHDARHQLGVARADNLLLNRKFEAAVNAWHEWQAKNNVS